MTPRHHILLVDDNDISQEVAQDMLEAMNFQVTVAGGGEQAIAISTKHKFDLILMDCRMPGVDGFAAAKHIRASAENLNTDTAIIALTGGDKEEELARCMEAGMTDFLGKPYDMKTLKTLLGKYLPEAGAH